ncbi:MAG: endo-1,4-beta-xylanase, partial [Lachnospiraceae bacterium]|nr:endo-1,4-beta-xylanase [Lachnospiraceae bacterium]
YPGAVYCWDVVNEAVDEGMGDPNSYFLCRTQCDGKPNPWYQTLGEDYVEQAFRSARKYAAEDVKLFYNDFNTYFTAKRDAIYRLCEHLKEEGLIDGIGMQAYWTGASTSAIELAIKRFAKLGLEIQITELSIDAEELSETQLKKQAERYGSLFYMLGYLDTQGGGPANITAVTLFGLQDGFVMYNGTDTTTSRILDKDFQPKPAFERIARIMENTYKNREE